MSRLIKPVIIGCDHAAFLLKEIIKRHLEKKGIPVTDAGTHTEASVDYADFGLKVAQSISRGEFERGILICGTGIGMSIVANRFAGVRATLCADIFSARMSRQHNDSNILVMGARVIGDALAVEIVNTWLEIPFEGGRHLARLQKFDQLGHLGRNTC